MLELARGGELFRSGDRGGGEDLVELDFLGDQPGELDALGVGDLAHGQEAEVGFAARHHRGGAAAPRRGRHLHAAGDAEAREDFLHEEDAARAARHRDHARLEHDSLEGIDAAHIGLGCARAHRDADRGSREVGVGAGLDAALGDQLGEAFAREDDDVARHAAGELRLDGLRAAALRGAGASVHLDAGGALEFRDELLVRTRESAGDEDLQSLSSRSALPCRTLALSSSESGTVSIHFGPGAFGTNG